MEANKKERRIQQNYETQLCKLEAHSMGFIEILDDYDYRDDKKKKKKKNKEFRSTTILNNNEK